MSCLARTATATRALLGPVAAATDAVIGALPGAPRRQRTSLHHVSHRPWPPPDAPWVMAQTWADLLFWHWPVAPEQLEPHVPASLPLDLFDGSAWLTITPFEVQGTRLRGLLPPPVLSRFPELNVRTYVTLGGRPGIWFFSLDADSMLAVAAARGLYRLPYLRARMEIAREGPWIDYRSERHDPRGAPARFEARYRPTGGVRHAEPGSLEAWLVERYRLYTVDERGDVFAGDIHHRPWTLQDAVADIRANTMTAMHGIDPAGEPLVQFARRQDVVFWPLRHVRAGRS
jgi:uncharacterized protein YqjF (DUF2071 family)